MTGFDTIRHADIDFGRSARVYYKLANRQSGKVLDAYGASLADGTNLVQWVENYKIRARHSGKLLGVAQGSPADGASVIQCPTRTCPNNSGSPESEWLSWS